MESVIGGGKRPVSIKQRWLRRNILFIGSAILAGFLLAGVVMTAYTRDSLISSLETRASTTAAYINKYLSVTYDQFYSFGFQAVEDFTEHDKVEMQVLDKEGRVMYSSSGLTVGFVQTTADVREALTQDRIGSYMGWDPGSNSQMAAVTAPVRDRDGFNIGGVRISSSTEPLRAALTQMYLMLGIGALALIFMVTALSQMFLNSIIKPILRVNTAAAEIAGGSYGQRVPVDSNDEIGQLCSTINHMSLELERSEIAKNDFISSVSHELRTPLTAIGGWAEAVAEDPTDLDNARAGLEIIVRESRRLNQMVNELLDFSRLESGRLQLQKELFDLGAELYDALLTYDDLLKSSGLEVDFAEPEEPVLIYGDRDRIRQVFLNLIDNACKYGSDGTALDVSLRVEGEYAYAAFRDYGAGIPADELPHIKEKFYKGSAIGKRKGTGIGLALCDEIVQMHEGRLEIVSEPGQGSCFTVCLPMPQ